MKQKKTVLSVLLGVMIVALAVMAIAIVFNRTGSDVTRLLSLGEKYLLNLDYEQAVAAFLQVIDVEPMNVRAYMGAAEAYAALGQTDLAIEVLRRGYEATGDAALLAGLEALEAERLAALATPVPPPTPTPPPTPEPTLTPEQTTNEDPNADTANCGADEWMGYNSSSVFFCEDDGFWMMNKDGSGRKKIYEYGNGVTIYKVTETQIYFYDRSNSGGIYDPIYEHIGYGRGSVVTFFVIDIGTGARRIKTAFNLRIDLPSGIGFFISDDLTQIMYFSIYEDAEPIELYKHPKQNEVIIDYSASMVQNVPKLYDIDTAEKTDDEEAARNAPWYRYKIDESGMPLPMGNDSHGFDIDDPYDAWQNATVMQNGNKVRLQEGSLVIRKVDGSEIVVVDSSRGSAPYLYTAKIPDRLYFWEVNQSKATLFYVDQNGGNKTAVNLTTQDEFGHRLYYCDGYICYYDYDTHNIHRMKPDGTENTVIFTAPYDSFFDFYAADTWVRLYGRTAGNTYYFYEYTDLIPVR